MDGVHNDRHHVPDCSQASNSQKNKNHLSQNSSLLHKEKLDQDSVNVLSRSFDVINNMLRSSSTEDDDLPYNVLLQKKLKAIVAYAEKNSINIIDLISGRYGKNILQRLYESDNAFVLCLIKDRLNILKEKYNVLDLNDLDELSNEQKEINFLFSIVRDLESKKDNDKFSELLHRLQNFEEEKNILSFQEKCHFALLKLANVDMSMMKVTSKLDNMASSSIQSILDSQLILYSYDGFGLFTRSFYRPLSGIIKKYCLDFCQAQHVETVQSIIQKLDYTSMLDSKNKGFLENVMHFCHTDTDLMYEIFTSFYKEKVRQKEDDEELKRAYDFIKGYASEENKSYFLQNIIQKDDVLQHWLQHHFSNLIFETHEKKILENDLSSYDFCQLYAFAQQAKQANYKVDQKILSHLETVRLQWIQQQINNTCTGNNVWFLENKQLSFSQIRAYLQTANNDFFALSVQALNDYFIAQQYTNSVDQLNAELIAQDKLYQSQINFYIQVLKYLVNNHALQKSVQERKDAFLNIAKKIGQIEKQRPSAGLLGQLHGENIVDTIGHFLIRGNNVPSSQTIKNLFIELQLKYEYQYSFRDQMNEYLQRLSTPFYYAAKKGLERIGLRKSERDHQHEDIQSEDLQLLENIEGNYKKEDHAGRCAWLKTTYKKMKDSVSGALNMSLVDIYRSCLLYKKDKSNQFLEMMTKEMNDYLVLCEANPSEAKMLAGNIMQAFSIIKSTFSPSSEIYALFDQFSWRVYGVATSSYFTEQFEESDMDLSKMDAHKIESMKRMLCLSQFFQYVPAVLASAQSTRSGFISLLTFSLPTAFWNFGKAVVQWTAANTVKEVVSSLSDAEVRAMNTAIMTWHYGAMEAGAWTQTMKSTAQFVVDTQQKRSLLYSARSFFRPLTTRYNRLKIAYNDWMIGKPNSRLSLALEVGKVAFLSFQLAVLFTMTPTLSQFASILIVGYVFAANSCLFLTSLYAFYYMDPLQDMTFLIKDKAQKLISKNAVSYLPKTSDDVKNSVEKGDYKVAIERLATQAFFEKNVVVLQEEYPVTFCNLDAEFEKSTHSPNYAKKVDELQEKLHELKQLDALLQTDIKRSELMKIIPTSDHESIPEKDEMLCYWMVKRIQNLHIFFYEKLGTLYIPNSKEALASRLKKYERQIYIGAHFIAKKEHEGLVGLKGVDEESIKQDIIQAISKKSEKNSSFIKRIMVQRAIEKVSQNHLFQAKSSEVLDDLLYAQKEAFQEALEAEKNYLRMMI